MSGRFRWQLLLLLVVVAGSEWAVRAMPPGAEGALGGSDYRIRDNVELVVLDAAVTNTKGAFVTNLQKADFRVYEDGRQQPITQFEKADTPVAVGLVVDSSGSMAGKRAEVVTAGLAFARESNSGDQFFVVHFNDSVTSGLPAGTAFTANLQMLRSALYFGPCQGRTALYDAVAFSLRHLALSSLERRTLIVVSDGRDNVSSTSLPDLLRIIGESRVTIYGVGLYDPAANDLNPGPLRKMASVTGGEFFEPREPFAIAPVLHHIAQGVRQRYTLSYVPPRTAAPGERHKIKVTANREGRPLHVRTRPSYWRIPTGVAWPN